MLNRAKQVFLTFFSSNSNHTKRIQILRIMKMSYPIVLQRDSSMSDVVWLNENESIDISINSIPLSHFGANLRTVW